jgi:hypothetical protein
MTDFEPSFMISSLVPTTSASFKETLVVRSATEMINAAARSVVSNMTWMVV